MRENQISLIPPQGIILSESSLRTAVVYFLKQDAFAFDVETSYDNRLVPHLNTVTWISLATKGSAVVIPMGHSRGAKTGTTTVATEYKTGKKAGTFYNRTIDVFDNAPEQMSPDVVFEILKPLFASGLVKIGHDVLFDLCSVAKYLGFIPPGPYFCTKTGAWLLDENNRRHTWLKEMIEDRYGVKYDAEGIGKCVEDFPFETVAYYSYSDSKWDYLIYKHQVEDLAAEGLNSIFKLEMNVLNTLTAMRLHGTPVDVPALKKLQVELSALLLKSETEIYRAAGHKFNLNSPAQKQQVLFVEQKLKPWKPTKAGIALQRAKQPLLLKHYSTDKEVLKDFISNPVARALLDYNDVNKALSSFVNAWLGTDAKPSQIFDGHIYARFQPYGTMTGRFSCTAPNLQQIPRSRKALGRSVKNIFIAESGHKLICADYSQMELVILAHYLGEGRLYDGVLEGLDAHTITAASVLGKSLEDVTEDERDWYGKSLNFAITYGAGPGKVATMAHLSLDGAKDILATHQRLFPEIYQLKEDVLELARSRTPVPYINTLLGRKRRLPGLNSRDRGLRQFSERRAFNSLLQGSLGDLNKLSMVRLDITLPDEAYLLLTVHDELVVSTPENMTVEVAALVEDAMIGPGIQKLLNVPMRIGMKIGSRWGEIK